MSRPLTERFYALLLRSRLASHYPAALRPEMERLFGDLRSESVRHRGRIGALLALGREVASLMRASWQERRYRETPPQQARLRRTPTRRERIMDQLRQDIAFAFRSYLKRPMAAVVAVLTLAVAIGAATTVFSVIYGVLIDALPFPEPQEVYHVLEADPEGGAITVPFENLRDWQDRAKSFEALAAWVGNSVAVTGGERPERIRGIFVSAAYFDVIGVEPVMGRAIAEGEDVPGGERTAVISHSFWQRRFGGDPDVLGKSVFLNNYEHTIVGVMPADYRPPFDSAEAWISLQTVPRPLDRDSHSLLVMGRLAEGVTAEEARQEMTSLMSGLAEAHPEHDGHGIWMQSVLERRREGQQSMLQVLAAAVAMVLLLACANVANLQLAQAAGRRREMALRMALGGRRGRLIRQLLTENLILALVGGALGLALAYAGVKGMESLHPAYGTYYNIHLNSSVLLVSLLITIAAGVLFGLAPAWKSSRCDLNQDLHDGGRGESDSRSSGRLRSALVVAQVGLAIMLLIGAGLLVRTIGNLAGVNPGFDTENLLTMEFRLPDNKYETDEQIVAFYDRMIPAVEAVPGALGVAIAQALPFSGNGGTMPLIREGQRVDVSEAPRVRNTPVNPGYFQAMGIDVLRGRVFEPSDRAGSLPVGVISQTAAERFFPDEDPLGQRVYYRDENTLVSIVGVVGDVKLSLTGDPEAHLYTSYSQFPARFSSLAVRTPGDPMALANQVRDAVWSVDPDQPVWEIMPITERIANTQGQRYLVLVLLTAFSLAALLLCCIGIYAVMGYAVHRRSREIGIRMALGAGRRQILRMVLRRGLIMTVLGLVLGIAGALALSQTMQSLLFGVEPSDLSTYLLAPLLLAAVALLACYLPARRATLLDPTRTLQQE
ncbi:MAG TPA: ABC transporter permease [Acidobacteriota bacterium]|nr:ABC transporter permease [Acidobacteriota bacterium]